MHIVRKVTDDITWIGSDDSKVRTFEDHYPVDGMTYNSYLLKDTEKTVLFDTCDKSQNKIFLDNLKYALDGRKPDIIVVHHAEPDHSATLGFVMSLYPDAKIASSAQAKKMIEQFTGVDISDRHILLKEGTEISTGKHTLKFISAPMVHWPEVMMTYDSCDKILFSADAFGKFGSRNGKLFDGEVSFDSELENHRRYYTNIVGKYGTQVMSVLKKAGLLDIKLICPLHGYIWRDKISDIIEKYSKWASYEPEIKGAFIAYSSVYGGTQEAAEYLANKLSENGVDALIKDVSHTDKSYLISSSFKYSNIVIATTTYNCEIFETMNEFLSCLVSHAVKNRKYSIIENGSWAPAAGKLIKEKLDGLGGSEYVGNTVTIKSFPSDENLAELDKLASDIKSSL